MIELRSPLSVQECLRALAELADPPWALFGRKQAVGKISGNSFCARKRLPAFVHNSFQPRITVRLVLEGGETILRCSFALNPFVKGFLIVWIGLFLLIGGEVVLGSIGQLRNTNAPEGAWLGLAIPPLMITFALALAGIGWSISASDKDFLVGLVRHATKSDVGAVRLATSP